MKCEVPKDQARLRIVPESRKDRLLLTRWWESIQNDKPVKPFFDLDLHGVRYIEIDLPLVIPQEGNP